MPIKEQVAGFDRYWRVISRAAILGGALTVAAACSGSSSNHHVQATAKSPETTAPASTPPRSSTNTPTLTFDALGGGPSIIKVYPGVGDTAADKTFNGTFNSGDTVPAECKTTGRMVHSDPSVGELDRQSDQWIRIQGTPGETQFATAVYVQNPAALLAKLATC